MKSHIVPMIIISIGFLVLCVAVNIIMIVDPKAGENVPVFNKIFLVVAMPMFSFLICRWRKQLQVKTEK